MFERIQEFLLDLLFPRFCLGCNSEGTYLCDDCKAVLDISEHRYCLCDELAVRIPKDKESGKCEKCSSKNLSGLFFALSYKERALTRKLVRFFKDQPYYLKSLAEPLSSLIIDHIFLLEKDPKDLFRDSVLMPVPIDKKEMKKTGYNPSEELAKALAKKLEIPLISKEIKDKKVFLVDVVYTNNSVMEKHAVELLKSGAREVWGITVTRD